MTAEAIYTAYATERRTVPLTDFRWEPQPHLTRYVSLTASMDGFVMFADLPAGKETELIREQIAYFKSIGQGFEWKVYDLDRPTNLRQLLAAEGFIAEPEEAFMVLPLPNHTTKSATRPTGVRVERVTTPQGIKDVVAVHDALWNWHSEWLETFLSRALTTHRDELSIYCAYAETHPVGIAWTDFTPGSKFADLHGGGVLPEYRGRGIYSLLFNERAQQAAQRGYKYLAVDAAPMSRPILLKKGFQHVCFTYPMKWRTVG